MKQIRGMLNSCRVVDRMTVTKEYFEYSGTWLVLLAISHATTTTLLKLRNKHQPRPHKGAASWGRALFQEHRRVTKFIRVSIAI